MVTKAKATTKVEETAQQATEVMQTTLKATQENAQKAYEQAVTMTVDNFDKASQKMTKTYEDVQAFSKQNVDAMIQASTIVTKAAEDLSKAVMAYAQSSMDMSVSAGKALLAAKTLREMVELQNDFARNSFDTMLAETTKMSELSVKAANQAIEPIQARLNAVIERVVRPVAA